MQGITKIHENTVSRTTFGAIWYVPIQSMLIHIYIHLWQNISKVIYNTQVTEVFYLNVRM